MKLFKIVSATALFVVVFSLGAAQTASANVADDLNVNYNKIVNNCGGSDKPGYLCSGNLVRLTAVDQYNAWDPSPRSGLHQAISFTYLRHDIKVDLQFDKKLSGIIYYPAMLHPDWTDTPEVTCAFPIDGWTWGRPDGCRKIVDKKNCQDLNIHTADGWYKDFMSRPVTNYIRYNEQCGFTMNDKGQDIAQEFNEVLKINSEIFDQTMLDANGISFNRYNEILVKPSLFNANYQIINPEKLPIQAFFYMVKNGNSALSDAQYYQQQYFEKAHVLVPIVKINDDDPANISFSYYSEDQGVTVADELNANYNKIVDNCGSKNSPAYQCSGVLARVVSNPGGNYHAWDPSVQSIQTGGISFGYFRRDAHFRNFMNMGRNSGFIYYPSQQTPSEVDETKVSCAFPAVGISDNRPYGRCGGSINYPQASSGCQAQGIYTAEDWYKHFSSFNGDKFLHQCGFDVSNCGHDTATAFSEAMKARNLVYNDNMQTIAAGSNEIIVRTQEVDVNGKTVNPEKLPLQAFFYNNATGLIEARTYQQDYYNTTGKIVPVVYMNVSDFNNISFEYKAADQVVSK